MKHTGRYLLLSASLSMLLSILPSCNRVNQNPPEYLKSIVAYKEGYDGLMIYFILADASGAMTSANGDVDLAISETCHNPFYLSNEFENPVYAATYRIERSMFVKTKVGQGAFAHDALVCPLGRIAYSSFKGRTAQTAGKVRIAFRVTEGSTKGANSATTQPGRVLKGEETVLF